MRKAVYQKCSMFWPGGTCDVSMLSVAYSGFKTRKELRNGPWESNGYTARCDPFTVVTRKKNDELESGQSNITSVGVGAKGTSLKPPARKRKLTEAEAEDLSKKAKP